MASQALAKGALWMQNVDYPASWDRALIDVLWATEGVIDGFAVTANGGLGIRVSAGRAVVSGDDTAANTGKYLVDNDANVDLTVASVGSNRTEYVWLSINDTAVAGGRAGNNVTIETSTTAVPESALLLATLTLVAGTVTITSGMIADNRVYADVVPPASITTAKLADNSVTSAKIVDGTIVAADLASNSVTTAKILDGNVTLAKLEATLQATIATIDPADAIIAIGGTTAPTGYALCDGTAYSRTTYAATFARIGTTYGAGDGSTTFNVPDLRGRFVAGKGTVAWSNVVGEVGGSKDAVAVPHTHNLPHTHGHPNHGHPGSSVSGSVTGDGAHSHTANGNGFVYWDTSYGTNQSATTPVGPNAPWALSWQASVGGGGHGHGWNGGVSVADGNAGTTNSQSTNTTNSQSPSASGTDANLPPYIALNYAIRLR